MHEPRLTDRSAPWKPRPISVSAAATSVALTQWVWASPSTSSSSGRPNCTLDPAAVGDGLVQPRGHPVVCAGTMPRQLEHVRHRVCQERVTCCS